MRVLMRARIRSAIVLVLTVLLLALFFRGSDLAAVWGEIRRARGWLIVGGLLITASTYVLRALRWQHLLEPIGSTRFWTAFKTTVIGFAASFLLPARAGEFVRPYLLARTEGLSATATFATIILERLLDLITVLLLFASFVLVFDPGMAAVDDRVYGAVKLGGSIAAVGALVALAIVFTLAGHPERLGRAALSAERVLPARAAAIFARLVQTFAEGLAVMRRPGALLAAMALSIPLWLSIATGVWLVARAFHVTLPFTGSFLLISLLVVGVSIPTPGAVGGFHEAFRLGATTFYGTPNDTAVGAALVLHAVSFLPVTAIGIFFMLHEGLNLGRVRLLAEQRGAAASQDPYAAVGEPTRDGSRP